MKTAAEMLSWLRNLDSEKLLTKYTETEAMAANGIRETASMDRKEFIFWRRLLREEVLRRMNH